MLEKHLTFNFEARYFKSGEITSSTEAIWFVLHGYGQLAQYFLKKFDPLIAHNICIIAPEGLSRFYLEDIETRSKTKNNRVGATWMTRENRLMDIRNYLTYLDQVYAEEVKNSSIPVTFFGFSQGAATASRWLLHDPIKCKRLILWAGIFPDDMDFEKAKTVLTDKQVTIVYGDQDPFLSPERTQTILDLMERAGVTAAPFVFKGGHELHTPTLLTLATL